MKEFENDLRPQVFGLDESELEVAKMLVNNSSYAGRKLSTDVRVPGRISDPKYYDFWENTLKANKFCLGIVKYGYKFPLISIPPKSYCRNNASFFKHRSFAYEELLRLEKLGCISSVKERPEVILPLSVVFSKKYRLVVDASRHLNPYMQDRKIKLETLEVCEDSIKEGDFQMCSDLDSGYWHVKLHPEHRKYVGVHFITDSGQVLYWVWNVLFLGVKVNIISIFV